MALPSFREFLRESGLVEDLPPDYTIREWVGENREKYYTDHGREHGERLLVSTAWKKFNSINKDT